MDLQAWWNDWSCEGLESAASSSLIKLKRYTMYRRRGLARTESAMMVVKKMLINKFVLRNFEFNKSSHAGTLKDILTLWWQLEPRNEVFMDPKLPQEVIARLPVTLRDKRRSKTKIDCKQYQAHRERGYSYGFRLHLRRRKQTSDKRYTVVDVKRRQEKVGVY